MNEKELRFEDLTEEQKAKVEKIKELLSKKENQERIASIKTVDEAIAFCEENGFSFKEEEKDQIRKNAEEKAEELKDIELTDEELAKAAGGFTWKNFIEINAFVYLFLGIGMGYLAADVADTASKKRLKSNE